MWYLVVVCALEVLRIQQLLSLRLAHYGQQLLLPAVQVGPL